MSPHSSQPPDHVAASHAGLLEKLMAAVRPEFRVDILVPDPDDPVLGVRLCRVAGCDNSVSQNGFCSGHARRWRDRGCPDRMAFSADPGPPLTGRTEPGACVV